MICLTADVNFWHVFIIFKFIKEWNGHETYQKKIKIEFGQQVIHWKRRAKNFYSSIFSSSRYAPRTLTCLSSIKAQLAIKYSF